MRGEREVESSLDDENLKEIRGSSYQLGSGQVFAENTIPNRFKGESGSFSILEENHINKREAKEQCSRLTVTVVG